MDGFNQMENTRQLIGFNYFQKMQSNIIKHIR